MSSLGDLLLGKVSEPAQSPPPASVKAKQSDHNDNNNDKSSQRNKKTSDGSPQSGGNESGGKDHDSQSVYQKVFPSRVEKNNIADDCQSNASSVDDYVAELLDPNDRPRNVWHVVEGPKESSPDQNDRAQNDKNRESDTDRRHTRQQSDDEAEDLDRYGPPSPRDTDREYRRMPRALDLDSVPKSEAEAPQINENNEEFNLVNSPTKRISQEEKQKHFDDTLKDKGVARDDLTEESPRLSRSKSGDLDKGNSHRADSRERSSSSRRHRHHRDSHRDRDRDDHSVKSRDRRSDRDRRRSPDRHSKSRRRHDHSDDDEEHDRRKRHRGSRSQRHDRRSHSRSRSTSISRRRNRSRSNSQSPVTKRNSRTILIMQLSPRVVERDLEDFFSDIGRVREVRLIMDSKTRRHKGIAYIEFDDASSATKALALNGQKFHGVPMQIQSALLDRVRGNDWHSSTSTHHHHSSNHTSSTYSSSRSLLPPNSYRVYVGGLHVGITEEMLRTIVEPFGMVHKIEVIKDRSTGVSRGYAFVTFANIEDGQEAVRNLDGFELAGKSLRVSKSTEKSGHQ